MPVDYTLLLENLLDPGHISMPPVIVTCIGHISPYIASKNIQAWIQSMAFLSYATAFVLQLHPCTRCMRPSKSDLPANHSQHSILSRCFCLYADAERSLSTHREHVNHLHFSGHVYKLCPSWVCTLLRILQLICEQIDMYLC